MQARQHKKQIVSNKCFFDVKTLRTLGNTGSPRLVRFLGRKTALIDFNNKSHKIRGKTAKTLTVLDNFACFWNCTIAKSGLIEIALCGDSMYYKNHSILPNVIFSNIFKVFFDYLRLIFLQILDSVGADSFVCFPMLKNPND